MNGDGHQLAHRPDRQEDVSQLSAGNSVLLKGLTSLAGFDVFCRWFDFQHQAMLVDRCDGPLTDESD